MSLRMEDDAGEFGNELIVDRAGEAIGEAHWGDKNS